MNPSMDVAFHALQLGLLGSASLVVPSGQRSEWLLEWRSELWHVRDSHRCSGGLSWEAEHEITSFCLGSFLDAACVRRHSWQDGPRPDAEAQPAGVHGSAGQCVLWLSTAVVLLMLLARLIPGVWAETDTARYHVNPNLILIGDASSRNSFTPSISPLEFRSWKGARQRYFDDLAYYRNIREMTSTRTHPQAQLNVAHSTANLFSMLGLRARTAAEPGHYNPDFPELILSHEAWKRDFGGDPDVIGSRVRLGRHTVIVAGVLPFGAWRLPGRPDAWLLESDSALAADAAPGESGYVVAHLTPLARSEMFGSYLPITAHTPDDSDVDLMGISFADRVEGPFKIFQFALFLALLALPAITSVSTGESSFSAHRLSWKMRFNRWAFLGAKLVLVAVMGYFGSLDLAYWPTSTYSATAEMVQLISCFCICLFGFSWSLIDQRQRCPVCLRRVTHPAHVGLASRTFLAWNGTEMICTGGHTLLHVPSLPTSWYGSQRWLYLDNSWEFLFAGSGIG